MLRCIYDLQNPSRSLPVGSQSSPAHTAVARKCQSMPACLPALTLTLTHLSHTYFYHTHTHRWLVQDSAVRWYGTVLHSTVRYCYGVEARLGEVCSKSAIISGALAREGRDGRKVGRIHRVGCGWLGSEAAPSRPRAHTQSAAVGASLTHSLTSLRLTSFRLGRS